MAYTGSSNVEGYIVGKSAKADGWGGTFYISDAYFYGGAVYEASDERKKNFRDDIEVDFETLSMIPKKYYTWKNDEKQIVQIGTSAQKLQEIYPELVATDKDGFMSVSYDRLVIITLAAIDKLHKENEELREILKSMTNK